MSGMLTPSAFTTFYPQFRGFTPGVVMETYIEQANARFSNMGEDAEEARRLYVAHKLTMYAGVSTDDGGTQTHAQIAAMGRSSRQQVTSKKVGEVAVSFGNSSSASSVSTGLVDLKETDFGLQLLSLLRIYGMTRYIP